ncbi:LADA_0G07800g1_1 [Lachancea dasiensis]|uniref:LADA_0G07800g1_1 n=1 Tax=Lachancea dasiensis TaxID=1072105 RepID=A0A1G4JTR8_9SACH|nr:LADA_0G07800g1_1 [Lachancea dasiensis]
MDETTDVWTKELNSYSYQHEQELHERLKVLTATGEKPKLSDELEGLIDRVLPRNETEELQEETTPRTLYGLLDVAPHGRKRMNQLLAGPHGSGDVFQHYENSAIHRTLAKTVDEWIVRQEDVAGGQRPGSRDVSQGEFSSAIFSWSSANRDKKATSSSQGSGRIGDIHRQYSLNQQLRSKAYEGIADLLARRRDQERQREIDSIASVTKTRMTPGGFKVDPLQKFEARALPKERKKKGPKQGKQTQSQKRSSLLWFWKRNDPETHTSEKPASAGRDVNPQDSQPPTNEAPALQCSQSADNGVTGAALQPSDDGEDDDDSVFGDFKSTSQRPVDMSSDDQVSLHKVPDFEPVGMGSFVPLQPKKKDLNST